MSQRRPTGSENSVGRRSGNRATLEAALRNVAVDYLQGQGSIFSSAFVRCPNADPLTRSSATEIMSEPPAGVITAPTDERQQVCAHFSCPALRALLIGQFGAEIGAAFQGTASVVKVSVERAIARGSSRGFEAVPPVWYVALPLPSSCATKDMRFAFSWLLLRQWPVAAAVVPLRLRPHEGQQ